MKIDSVSKISSPISNIKKVSKAGILLTTSLLSTHSFAKLSNEFSPVYKNKVEIVRHIPKTTDNFIKVTNEASKNKIPLSEEEFFHRLALSFGLFSFCAPIILNMLTYKSK